MVYTGRLRSKEVPFSGFKGTREGIHEFMNMEGQEIGFAIHGNDKKTFCFSDKSMAYLRGTIFQWKIFEKGTFSVSSI